MAGEGAAAHMSTAGRILIGEGLAHILNRPIFLAFTPDGLGADSAMKRPPATYPAAHRAPKLIAYELFPAPVF